MARGKESYYAVQNGREAGVYNSWDDARQQVDGYSGGVHQRFDTRAEAEAFAGGSGGYGGRSGGSSGGGGYDGSYNSSGYGGSSYDDDYDDSYSTTSGRQAVYTDGACSNNQNSSRAQAGVGVYFGRDHPDNVSRPVAGSRQTNQRAELEAIHDAVETIHQRNDGLKYEIKTDSAYAKNAYDKWGDNWQQNNWTTSKNEPVQHRDVIEPTLDRLNDLGDRVKISKVKGHSGNRGNDAADELAVRGARGY